MTTHKAIRDALEAGPTSALYTHPRDDNMWMQNEAFATACNPAAIRAILADLDAKTEALKRISCINNLLFGGDWDARAIARAALKGTP